MDTIAIVKEVLNEVLDIDPANVSADSTFDSLGIDSLDLVQLTMEIEERLNIDLGEFEDAENIKTLGDFAQYIDNL